MLRAGVIGAFGFSAFSVAIEYVMTDVLDPKKLGQPGGDE